MIENNSKDKFMSGHEDENREAEKLAQELESPLGAQRLGDEAYELVKKEIEEKRMKS